MSNGLNNAGRTWVTHICYGKKNLDRVLSFLNASPFADDPALFIRDSDFDRFLDVFPTDQKIFLTCGYSVENYVCTPEVLVGFIRASFGVDSTEVDVNGLVERYKHSLDTFFRWLSPFIGAALYAIKDGAVLDLNQMDVRERYRGILMGDRLDDRPSTDMARKCGIRPECFNDESRMLGEEYTRQDAALWLRGKYVLQCAGTFLIWQMEDLRNMYNALKIHRFNRRVNPNFSDDAVFERLGAFAHGTVELNNALRRGFDLVK